MFDNLPDELHWNIFKYLRHPVAEVFLNERVVNRFIATQEDTYMDTDGETYEINELINFYDMWRLSKYLNLRKKTRVIYRYV
jgi:hypothetical protein